MDERYEVEDPQVDILSHSARGNTIHILTLDPILATDVYERIHHDPRMKHVQLIKPSQTKIRAIDR